MSESRGIFRGWLLVGAAALALAGSTGLMVNSYSQFIKPVCGQFGFERAEFVLYATLQTAALMLLIPLNAAVFSRLNPRCVVVLAGVLATACWAGLSSARALSHFYLLGLGIGAGLAFIGTASMNIIINNWFLARNGLAIGLTLLGSGVGAMVWNPVLARLIIAWGPQAAYGLSGLIALCLMLPFFLLFRFRPEDLGLEPLGAGQKSGAERPARASVAQEVRPSGIRYGAAVRTGRFWALALTLSFFPFSMLGVFSQLQPFLTDLGFSPVFAAAALSVGGFFQVAGRPCLGLSRDKLGARALLALAAALCLIALLGVTLLACFPGAPLPFLYLAAAIFGAAAAAPAVMAPLLTEAAFGRRDFAAIYGTIGSVWYLGPALGPLFAAFVFDSTGSYLPAFIVFMAGMPLALYTGLRALRTVAK